MTTEVTAYQAADGTLFLTKDVCDNYDKYHDTTQNSKLEALWNDWYHNETTLHIDDDGSSTVVVAFLNEKYNDIIIIMD